MGKKIGFGRIKSQTLGSTYTNKFVPCGVVTSTLANWVHLDGDVLSLSYLNLNHCRKMVNGASVSHYEIHVTDRHI